MKPILLTMSAFGPFGDRQVVDFEKLGVTGLFLISGDTGAGKTTIFNLLTGIYDLTEGIIKLEGNIISGKTPQEILKSGISRTFQNIRLFKNMRVIENVLVGMNIETKYNFFNSLFRTKKYKAEERRCQEEAIRILKDIGMYEKLHEYASNLPYGDQRKLEIARAIATGAKINIEVKAAIMDTIPNLTILCIIKLLFSFQL